MVAPFKLVGSPRDEAPVRKSVLPRIGKAVRLIATLIGLAAMAGAFAGIAMAVAYLTFKALT